MKISRRFTKQGQDAFSTVQYEKRTSRITNPDGSVVFEMTDAEIPRPWSQLATDIMVSKYFRKAGVPQQDVNGQILRDAGGQVVTGPERSVKQVINRLAGCWRRWGVAYGYFDASVEARGFKYGSGTRSNFSKLRGEEELLSGGGKSSGLMSFLRIGDRAAGAIKSGGTTRRAAKMCCLDLDHPDVEQFINWKVREELKVACMAEGIKHLPKEHKELAKKLGLKLDYDFNGEAYYTVSGQNSNNSVRIPNRFFKAVEEDGAWNLTRRTDAKIPKSLKARAL